MTPKNDLPPTEDLLRTTLEGAISPHAAIDVEALLIAKSKPELWATGADLFWDDPHISREMLKVHLDPAIDLASRRPETIDRTVEWLVRALGAAPGTQVLDLGCGPGLYSQRLAERGISVTGVDYSRNSLAYARAQAAEAGLAIKYAYMDYRSLAYQAEFDLALLIYYDLGAMSDADRDEVLRRVWTALRPGGRFAFDVMTRPGRAGARAESGWRPSRGGFWRPGPHLVLTDVFEYPENHAELDQYLVIEEDGRYSVYRVWTRYYDLEEITGVVERAGFEVEGIWADLTGRPIGTTGPAGAGTDGAQDEGLAIVARRPG